MPIYFISLIKFTNIINFLAVFLLFVNFSLLDPDLHIEYGEKMKANPCGSTALVTKMHQCMLLLRV